ncbi:MAG: hypothetical protein L0H84_08685, partial [Pseudonocardia sp.]|nr:hypothetical protein [Pseudonocardia sp.]
RYPSPVPASQAIGLLRRACDTEHHDFWDCDLSITDSDVVHPDRVHGPKQVTDVYLLAMAVARKGRFVTFDGSIPLSAVPGAEPRHLVVI